MRKTKILISIILVVLFSLQTLALSGAPLNVLVNMVNGTPRLSVDGKQYVPTVFFGNTDMAEGSNYVPEQVSLAGSNGVNLHSVIYNLMFSDDYTNTESWTYRKLRSCMDQVIKGNATQTGDPNAKIILRVSVVAAYGAWQYSSYEQVPLPWRDQLIKYTNGDFTDPDGNYVVSMASDEWAAQANAKLATVVTYLLNHPDYADHIAGIHLENYEWFQHGFREKGSDVSATNDAKFRSWLLTKYGSLSEINNAWGTSYTDISQAIVPRDLPNNLSGDAPYANTLLLTKAEQRFVDYNDYINWLTSDRINTLAKTVKEASSNKLMCISFAGYTFELADAQSGHFDMRTLLDSPYLDGFAAPVTYNDRTYNTGGLNPNNSPVGATSAYMSLADSVVRAGKIWFQESDERANINPEVTYTDTFLPPVQSVNDMINVHKREMGSNIIHGTGMWAMDLVGKGWLYSSPVWKNLSQLNMIYQNYAASQTSRSKFDVALVVDEKAESINGQPSFTGISYDLLSNARLECYRAGVSFSLVELGEVLAGKVDDAKVYIFLNPYRLSSAQVTTLRSRIQNNNKLSVFMYGFGNLSATDISNLTGGMTISTDTTGSSAMTLSSAATSTLPGSVTPSNPRNLTPRYKVTSGQSTVLGRYGSSGSSGTISFALKNNTNYKSIFFGATYLNKENIRAFAKLAGAQVFSANNDVVVANENMISYCATVAGSKTLSFNSATNVYDYFANTWYYNVPSINFTAATGETKYFFYGSVPSINAMSLPSWSGFVTLDSVSLSGTAVTGSTLSVTPTFSAAVASPDISYQWQKSTDGTLNWTDIAGANASTYTPNYADVGYYLRAIVTSNGTNVLAASKITNKTALTATNISLSSANVSGYAVVGATLSASAEYSAEISNPVIKYQWQRSNNGIDGWVNISGAVSAAYTLSSADLGKYIRAAITSNDNRLLAGTASSAATGIVKSDIVLTGVSVSGTAKIGNVLTGSASYSAAVTTPDIRYIWQRSVNKDTWVDIPLANSVTYILTQEDVGNYIRLKVVSNDTNVAMSEAVSMPSALIADSISITAAAFTGTEKEGSVLSAFVSYNKTFTFTPDITLTWQRSANGIDYSDIPNANSTSYILTAADAGKYIRLRAVSNGTNIEAGTVYSVSSGIIAEKFIMTSVSVSGLEKIGNTLSASLQLNKPFPGTPSVAYIWQRSANGIDYTDIAGANSVSYILTENDISCYIRLKVVSNGTNIEAGTLYSQPTAAIKGIYNITSVSLSGSAVAGNTLSVSWNLDKPYPGTLNPALKWQRSLDGNNWTDISGEISAAYILKVADIGYFIRCNVSSDGQFVEPCSLFTASSAAVADGVRIKSVSISGTLKTGTTVNAAVVYEGVGNTPAPVFQWKISDDGINWINIDGAIAASLTLTNDMAGKYIKVEVSYNGSTAVSDIQTVTATPVNPPKKSVWERFLEFIQKIVAFFQNMFK